MEAPDIAEIIDIIVSDEKLFNYIMKLVRHRIPRKMRKDPSQCTRIIDMSIEYALQEVKVLDIVKNLLRQQSQLDHEESKQQESRGFATELSVQNPSDREMKPNFSDNEPIQMTNASPKRVLRSINKHKPLPDSQSEPSFEIEPHSDLDNRNNFNLEIDVDVKRDFSYGHSDIMDPAASILSRADSEASTVQMMVVPLGSLDERDSISPAVDATGSKVISPPRHSIVHYPETASSSSSQHSVGEKEPYTENNNEDDFDADFPVRRDISPSYNNNSDFNGDHNEDADHNDSVHRSFETPGSESSASPYLDTPADISPRLKDIDPLDSWEKRIEESLSHDRQREEDNGMQIELEDSPRLQSASNSPKRSPTSRYAETVSPTAVKPHQQHPPAEATSKNTVDAEEDQEENNDDDDQSSEYSFEYVNDSRLSTTDDGDHVQQHRALHLSREAADTSATLLPVEGTFLRSVSDDLTLSSHLPKIPASSSSTSDATSHVDKSNGTGTQSMQPVYFDLDQFNDMVDASLGEKPTLKKRVSFRDNIITDIYYRDRVTKEEQPLMFYSHEEESQFNEDQYEEALEAENLGMSWQDWVQEHLHDPVEPDVSESQRSTGIAVSPSNHHHHHMANNSNHNNRSNLDYYTSDEDEFEVGEDTADDFGDDDAF